MSFWRRRPADNRPEAKRHAAERRLAAFEEKAKAVYQGVDPLTAADIADCATWAATRPPHVHIHDILITPTAQASVSKVVRR